MVKIEDIEKKLKSNKLDSLYLLFGEETFLIDSCLKKIKKLFGECVKGINYITTGEEEIGSVISNIETPAFGFEKKLIIIKNSGLFKKEGKKKNSNMATTKEKLNNYINENIEIVKNSNVIVFVEEAVSKCDLFNTIEKNGVVCEFKFQKPMQISKRLKPICNAYGVDIDSQTMQYLIECVGTNMQSLINEIRKLIEYAGKGGKITKSDIDKLTIKQIDSVIFDLTDNLGKKHTAQALQVLDDLIYEKEPIQKILITLYNHFKKLYLTKLSLESGQNVKENLGLKPNQIFLVQKYIMQANYFEIVELEKILKELIDLDYKYKIGLIDVEVGLKSILCAYC